MAQPVIASPHAVKGLVFDQWQKPFAICKDPANWIDTISRVWQDTSYATHLASSAHKWVKDYHTWPKAAKMMTTWINTLLTDEHIETPNLQPITSNTSKNNAA